MSDQDNAGDGGQQQGDDGGHEFRPITSQEELDRVLGQRLARERARFSDYDDLKTKAAKLDEIEQASKTELERERERAEQAEQRAALAEQTSLRVRIATEEGVIPEVLTGSTEEEMRAAAKRVIEWRDSGKRPAPKVQSLKSGSGSDGDAGTSRAAAAVRRLRQGG